MSDPEIGLRHLAAEVDRARLQLGRSNHDLAKIARAARSTVSRLINEAAVPRRDRTFDRIGCALGWHPGSWRCEANNAHRCASWCAGSGADSPVSKLLPANSNIDDRTG